MNINSIKHFFSYPIAIFTIISTLLILGLAFVAWPSADDFSIVVDVRNYNFISYGLHQYMHWDGRLLSSLLSVIFFKNLNYFSIKLLIMVLIYIIECILVAYFIYISENKSSKFSFFFLILLVLISMWLGIYPIINETVYWLTGSINYTLTPSINILWLIIIFQLTQNNKQLPGLVITLPLFFLLSFFVGMGNQASSPALLILSLFLIATSKIKLRENSIALTGIIILCIGLIVLFIAPGNFERAQRYGLHSFRLSPLILYHNYYNAFKQFYLLGNKIIQWAILSSWSYSIYLYLFEKYTLPDLNFGSYYQKNKKPIIFVIFLFVSILLSVAPFILVPDFSASRASIFFQIFLFLFVWKIVAMISPYFYYIYEKFNTAIIVVLLYIVPLMLGINFLQLISFTYSEGFSVKKQFNERLQYLSHLSIDEKRKDIIVKPIIGPLPHALMFNDISSDTSYWINTKISSFYGIKSIRLGN